jgi:hypothetical protein
MAFPHPFIGRNDISTALRKNDNPVPQSIISLWHISGKHRVAPRKICYGGNSPFEPPDLKILLN